MPAVPNTPGNPWLVKGILAVLGITAVAAASLTFYGKSIDVQVDGIAATSTDGVTVSNNTAALVGVPVQQSPRLRLRSNVWDTDSLVSDSWDWIEEAVPSSDSTTFSSWLLGSSKNGAATSNALTITSAGNMTASGVISGLFLRGSAGALTAGTMTPAQQYRVVALCHSYTWTNAMVTGLGAVTSGDVTVATLPAKTRVLHTYVVVTTAGTNLGAATLTATLGRDAEFDDYLVAGSLLAGPNTVYGDAIAEIGGSLTDHIGDLPSWTATTAVKVRFTTDGAGGKTLADVLTCTGSVYILTETLP